MNLQAELLDIGTSGFGFNFSRNCCPRKFLARTAIEALRMLILRHRTGQLLYFVKFIQKTSKIYPFQAPVSILAPNVERAAYPSFPPHNLTLRKEALIFSSRKASTSGSPLNDSSFNSSSSSSMVWSCCRAQLSRNSCLILG